MIGCVKKEMSAKIVSIEPKDNGQNQVDVWRTRALTAVDFVCAPSPIDRVVFDECDCYPCLLNKSHSSISSVVNRSKYGHIIITVFHVLWQRECPH